MIVVLKFGGSSLATPEQIKAIASRVVGEKKSGKDVVVVVSAMGEDTDRLLSLAERISPNAPKRELDMLLTAGERISMALLAIAIHDLGFQAVSFTGSQVGIITDSKHTRARILEVKGDRLRAALRKGEVAIVAGFQGVTPDKEVTTLGRGGSDITAVALAARLKANRCEIFTDVDGVYTADPKIAPRARRLSEISYEEMMELSRNGSKILHPEAVELAAKNGIELRVSPSLHESQGTRVGAYSNTSIQVRDSTASGGLVRGIAADEEIALLTITHVPRSHPNIPLTKGGRGDFTQIVSTLAEEGMPVRLFYHGSGDEKTVDLSFLISHADVKESLKVLERISKNLGAKEVKVRQDVGSISIVGTGAGSSSLLLSRVCDLLASLGVHIETVSTSETKVTCVIHREAIQKAVKALVKEFGLEEK